MRVDSIAKGHQDYHSIQAKPSYMLKVNRADLLAYQGLELEIGWLPLLIRGGRNAAVRPGKVGNMDVSSAIPTIKIPEGDVDRSMGDIHPLGNPHYHLNPENGVAIAEAFAYRLAQLDPENAITYEKNAEDFGKKVRKKILSWKNRLKPFSGSWIVTYHKTFEYLLDFFGIESAGTVEDPPGVPPGSRHLATLARTMKQTGVRLILQPNFFERQYSDLLAEKAGAKVLVVPASVDGEKSVTDYIALLDFLVEKLAAALSETQSMSHLKK